MIGVLILLALGSELPGADRLFAADGTPAGLGGSAPIALHLTNSDGKLREQLQKLADALNRRNLDAIRAQISPSRIYVEIENRAGAYLSNSQTMVVMESFFQTRSSISSTFDFVSDDGTNGSASGTLAARKDGRTVTYHLNFGFTRNDRGSWLLTRISMK